MSVGCDSLPGERFAGVSKAWSAKFQSWLFAEIDPQILALFFKELLLHDELTGFAFQSLLLLLFEGWRDSYLQRSQARALPAPSSTGSLVLGLAHWPERSR